MTSASALTDGCLSPDFHLDMTKPQASRILVNRQHEGIEL